MIVTGAMVTAFFSKNFEKIFGLAKKAYQAVDEDIQIALKTAYDEYLQKTSDKYSKSKSFFIRNEPTNLYSYYVPIGISCNGQRIVEPDVDNCIVKSNRLIISGSGGSGKSVLLKHLFLNCIASGSYVPIMIELRDLNGAETTLNEIITEILSDFGFNVSGNYIEKAKKAGHFCFFLDGYDEITHVHRKRLLKEIKALSKRYPECPVIISSRPDEAFNGLEEFSNYHVLPLNINTASKLVEKLPFDEEIKSKFQKDLHERLFESHRSFLSNPLLLSIMLLTYGENSEIPSKLSIFYNQAYEALFLRHDAYKGGFNRGRLTKLDIQDFSRVFSVFSLLTYDRREFKMPRTTCLGHIDKSRQALMLDFTIEDYLDDLLSAACLLTEEGLEIAFSHRSFQEYFVAMHISSATPEIQEHLLDRYWKNMNSDSVIYLLHEINPDLVERVLLVPKLSKMFEDIGVKRKVGITHVMRFFKKQFITLNIERSRITASAAELEATVYELAGLVARNYGGYVFPDQKLFDEREAKYVEEFGVKNEIVSIPIAKLTSNHPILKEFMNWEGNFSIKHLQAAYDGFKKLKAKHENRLQKLDSLLGIS
ncbi:MULTISPECIES: NACHT domain-containing protein [unclassified Pseudomonas]|uniref:NACHT domain-containing protein n=1 Tax=unclassified Pseudomonas TaxID=196821 RepID=UPI001F5616DE|nr:MULTISPECIES: NACHT domain-containing protein [unclassified Pseudomonas]